MNDLIKQALAAFEALSPEDRQIMREEQRKSFAENNVALSQGEGVPVLTHRRYWTLEEYKIWKGLDEKVAQWATSTHQFHFSEYEQAQEMLDYISGNVPSGVYRIAARYCEAQSEQCLETIGYQFRLRSGEWCREVSKYPYESKESTRALVDRENAIAMIADRDAKIRAGALEIEALKVEVANLKRDREHADEALINKYRDLDTGLFSFPGDVVKIIRKLESDKFESAIAWREAFDGMHRRAMNAEFLLAITKEALRFYEDVSKYPAPLTGGMGDLWSDCGAIARAALSDAWDATHQHKKRGSKYRLFGFGKMQSDSWVYPHHFVDMGENETEMRSVDMQEAAVYLEEDGTIWIRPIGEFNDGRFLQLD